MSWTDTLVRWLYLLMAVMLIGGSLFFWLVLTPESYRFASGELEGSRIINRVSGRMIVRYVNADEMEKLRLLRKKTR